MPDVSREQLIIFTRFPEPGAAKSRLIPLLGATGAAKLQRQMTEHIIIKLQALIASRPLPVQVSFEGGSEKRMREWLGSKFAFRPQGQGDIGLRMGRALAAAFESGCGAVVLIGADIPDITGDIIQSALDGLAENDLVLGPASDGGYYLIGMGPAAFAKANPQIFRGIRWGTAAVLTQTLAVAKELGLKYLLVDMLDDVDRPEDMAVWDRARRNAATAPASPRISVILPTLNEAENIHATIYRLQQGRNVEIVVVDGGSRDGTVAAAESLGAKVVSSRPSKAGQMNAGAAEATGDVLLFLHADTRLPRGFERQVRDAVNRNGFCAGAFKLGIDADARGLRLIERVANWRSRYLQMPYGDQGIFILRDLFNAVGGFADIPIMEDFDLIRRLKRKTKIAILDASVSTSARRWLNFGILKTWLLNQIIIGAYYLGISPVRLARWYRRENGKSLKRQ